MYQALAASGLYGLMTYSVQNRRKELAMRTALGATPFELQGMVVRQALRFDGLWSLSRNSVGRGADSRNRQFTLRRTDLGCHDARNRDSIALCGFSVRSLCSLSASKPGRPSRGLRLEA